MIGDPELAEGIRARNERRRSVFRNLVNRMVERGEVQKARAADLVDLLFALTGLPFYLELSMPGPSARTTAQAPRQAGEDAIARAHTVRGRKKK